MATTKGLLPDQRATTPVFDQENFGFKPSKQQPPDIMKPNKRVSCPVESISSKNFSKPGNVWKMSARNEAEQNAPYFETDDSVLKEKNQMDIEYRRDEDEEPLQSKPVSAYYNELPVSQGGNCMDVERPHLGNIMQTQPEYYGGNDMGRDSLLMAREKKQALKRGQGESPEESLDEMRQRHKELINTILKNEDTILVKQKEALDSKILKIKEEMALLNCFEKGGMYYIKLDCNYPEYLAQMKDYIAMHMRIEQNMLTLLNEFEEKINREKSLALRIKQRENAQEVNDVFSNNLLNGIE